MSAAAMICKQQFGWIAASGHEIYTFRRQVSFLFAAVLAWINLPQFNFFLISVLLFLVGVTSVLVLITLKRIADELAKNTRALNQLLKHFKPNHENGQDNG